MVNGSAVDTIGFRPLEWFFFEVEIVRRQHLSRKHLSLFIGLITPYSGVLSGIYYFRFSPEFIFGFPALYFWIFLWFVLTSLCLCAAWRIDRDHCPDDVTPE